MKNKKWKRQAKRLKAYCLSKTSDDCSFGCKGYRLCSLLYRTEEEVIASVQLRHLEKFIRKVNITNDYINKNKYKFKGIK